MPRQQISQASNNFVAGCIVNLANKTLVYGLLFPSASKFCYRSHKTAKYFAEKWHRRTYWWRGSVGLSNCSGPETFHENYWFLQTCLTIQAHYFRKCNMADKVLQYALHVPLTLETWYVVYGGRIQREAGSRIGLDSKVERPGTRLV